jgi:hypothetical protein
MPRKTYKQKSRKHRRRTIRRRRGGYNSAPWPPNQKAFGVSTPVNSDNVVHGIATL